MKNIEQAFSQQIEVAVQSIVAASHRAASMALDQAFSTAGANERRTAKESTTVSSSGSRRTAKEIGALSAQLYDAICTNPGETMAVIVEHVGASSYALQVPVARLKRAGRIKTVGQRQFMRYFPVASEETPLS